jgi:hypothetical protein
MSISEARLNANRRNAQLSTGPKTPEGKAASSANALTHGLTATKLIPEREAAEVQRRRQAFYEELRPRGEVGQTLVERAAVLSVRMERCVHHENAMLIERTRQALADFVVPEGVTEPVEIARLMLEAQQRALFDPSKEATLARRYEQAAERGFFKALKELRLIEQAADDAEEAAVTAITDNLLGSFSRKPAPTKDGDTILRSVNPQGRPIPPNLADWDEFLAQNRRDEVAMTLGRRS